MLRNKTQTCWIYSLYRSWKIAIGPVPVLKKIKMIESERASERAGGPARKQEYVVVKKKKQLTFRWYGII